MLVLNIRYSIWTVWLHALRSDRRPAVLRMMNREFRSVPRPAMTPYLVEIHLLTLAVVNEELEVLLYQRPGLVGSGRLLREERQHVNVDGVDGVEDVLRAAALLVAIRELADGDGDVQARQVLLREQHLLRELVVREHVVEERLRAELDHARHELCQGVRVQSGEESVASRDPDIIAIEPKLREKRQDQGLGSCTKTLTQTSAWTPSPRVRGKCTRWTTLRFRTHH